MQRLVLAMILVVTTFPYLSNGDNFGRMRLLPSSAAYMPEVLSALAVLLVIALGVRDSFKFVRPAYWVAFGALLLSIVCGVIANAVDSGPVFAGLRLYLRALPWFFIPAVFAFSERQVRTQLNLLMAICLVQLPIAVEQRMKTSQNEMGFVAITGDWTTGTIGDAGVLSIFLIAAACVAVAMLEKRQLRLVRFLPLFLLLLIPTTINETKAVVIFLPIGLLVATLCAAAPGVRAKRVVVGLSLLLLFGAIFVPVYDALNADREYSSTLGEFFLDKNKVAQYVSPTATGAEAEQPGRADAIIVPMRALSRDPAAFAFGYGIGNASESSWGASFSGKYAQEFKRFLQSALSRFLLELGVLGVILVLFVYVLIFEDCRAVARSGVTFTAGLAAGWAGVVAFMTIALFYALVEVFPAVSFLFWYFSGLVAAQRMRFALANDSKVGNKAGFAAPV